MALGARRQLAEKHALPAQPVAASEFRNLPLGGKLGRLRLRLGPGQVEAAEGKGALDLGLLFGMPRG